MRFYFLIVILLIYNLKCFANGSYFYIPASTPSSFSIENYNQLRNYFIQKFALNVYSKTGKTLIIPDEWESPFMGFFAVMKNPVAEIHLWGGGFRTKEMNFQIASTVICHELGHFISDGPYQTIEGFEWAHTEGASDFFASSTCLPEVIKDHPEWFSIKSQLQECQENKICLQISNSGFDFLSFFSKYNSSMKNDFKMTTWAPKAQELVINSYPSEQCRLDSYKLGALCNLHPSSEFCSWPRCWNGNNLNVSK